ncbi:zinc finger protein 7-like, partial [Plectropomus leopardus]|uniref:zinc finger protein 7-like n=1 Tax=Plectropomus leopardus TaxID=160734 RepID=UPI001C4D117F
MWQVARQQSVKHYGMLEDFVSMVTEVVPQLLTDRQKSVLLLALRAKVTLSDSQAGHAHLEKIRSVSEATVDGWCSALKTLTDKLMRSPTDTQRLLQEVFDHSFDSALQSLLSDFLSRIEQLFPVPDFKQVASWLSAAPGGLEECLQEADRDDLRELLTNQSGQLGHVTTTVSQDSEKILLAAWSHPLLTQLINPEPDPAPAESIQSDPLPDVEMVKVEVVVMTEDEQEEVEETVIGQSPGEPEASSGSSAVGGVTSVVMEVDRLKDSPGTFADQSEDAVDQSDQACTEVTANALYSISHNSQRVAHKCPQCGKCFIYRSQVIRHLRTNKSCGSALTGAVSLPEEEPRLPEPRPSRTHSCFQCNAVFKTKAELLSHQRSHRARPVYQCGQCDKEFHHLSSLTNHKQTHLGRGGFTCSRCDKVFESAKERDAHRLQHRLPDLTCTVCDQTFSSQTQLLRHLQTHSVEGAEPCYSCRFCDQTFS